MALTFSEWQQRRLDVPEADRLILMITAPGSAGMNRRQIGAAISLDRDVLDQLLTGMVSVGVLVVTTGEDGGVVYRATTTVV